MTPMSIEERRRRLLLASGDSELVRKYPALVRTGQDIIHRNVDLLAGLFTPTTACADSSEPESAACPAIMPLLKPVGNDCNMRCRYCNTRPTTPDGRCMSPALLERITQELLSSAPHKIDFIFHGGEPLLAGIDFFKTAMVLQKKYARNGQVIRNHVQTNGTLITKDWARFFAGHDFFVGVSLDGPEKAHNSQRIGPDGTGSYKRVMQGIAHLQKAGAKTQAIAVVPPTLLIPAQDLFRFMQDTQIPKWRVNHCRSTANIATYPDYINDLFQKWMTTPDACDIAIISETIQGLLGYPVHTCWMTGNCTRFVGFEPDGSISPCCEMPMPPEYVYGNLMDQTLRGIMTGSVAQEFHRAINQGKSECIDCDWRHLCGGGCAYTRIQIAASTSAPDPMCRLYQNVFSRLEESLDKALDQISSNFSAREQKPIANILT